MDIVATFDPSITTSDTFTVPQSAANGKMVVYNESSISLTFAFQNGYTAYIPAWMAVLFCGPFGSVNVSWSQKAQLISNTPPLSIVIVETYASGEPVPGTFPAPLVRQANIGNAVGLSTSATSIANDGNVAGTSMVEATVQGDGSSAVSWTNAAVLINGNATHPGSVSLDNGKVTTDGAGTLETTGANGIISSSGKYGKSAAGDVIDASGSGIRFVGHGGDILFQSPSGTEIGRITNEGVMSIPGFVQSINGGAAGTATAKIVLTGGAQYTLIRLNGFKTGGGPQNLSPPIPYTSGAKISVGDVGAFSLLASGVAQSMNIITALAVGGGTTTPSTTINKNSFAEIPTAFDTIQFAGGNASTHTGFIILEGL